MAPSRPPPAKGPLTQASLNTFFKQRDPASAAIKPVLDENNRATKKANPTPSSSAKSTIGSPAKQTTRSPAKPTKSPSKGADRVLTDVLLAIKPIHLGNIVSRQKNHEYRKYRLRDGVARLWLYETGEGGAGRAAITYVQYLPFRTQRRRAR